MPRPDLALNASMTFDFYVWQGASDSPGALVASSTGVVVPTPGGAPAIWTVRIPISTAVLTYPWCGVRIRPPAVGSQAVGLAADLNGMSEVPPKTKIAPGLGYPTGWQDASIVFGPVAALGIDAYMCNLELPGDTFGWAGGSDDEGVVPTGTWNFERFVPGEFEAEPCEYSLPDTFGSISDYEGWAPSPGSNLAAGLRPASDVSPDPDFGPEANVEGQALWFYHPAGSVSTVPVKGPPADKPKVAKKRVIGFTNGYKPVPQYKQDRKHVCMVMAAASCLSYWATNGYPEILPNGSVKELQDSLAKIMDPKEAQGMTGIEKYLGRRGVAPKPPRNAPPRPPLKVESFKDKDAKWNVLKDNLERNHDVMIGLKAYRDSAGIKVEARSNGHHIAHMVTLGQITEEDGKVAVAADDKKEIKVAQPNHETKDPVTDPKVYEGMKATVDSVSGQIKLENKELQDAYKGLSGHPIEYLCVTEIWVVRPDPPNDPPPPGPNGTVPGRRRATPNVASFVRRQPVVAGPDTLVQYDYRLGPNPHDTPLDYFALVIDVPYYDVQTPPGWTWEPLPSIPPGGKSCESAITPKGIAWRTLSSPVSPGDSRSGFSFRSPTRFPVDSIALTSYVNRMPSSAELDLLLGPGPIPSSASVPTPLPGSGLSGLRGIPNPSRGEIVLSFTSAFGGPGRLTVHDVSGRVVREFSLTEVVVGQNRIAWDRADDGRRPVRPGVYFYRVEVAGRRSEQQIVLVE